MYFFYLKIHNYFVVIILLLRVIVSLIQLLETVHNICKV